MGFFMAMLTLLLSGMRKESLLVRGFELSLPELLVVFLNEAS